MSLFSVCRLSARPRTRRTAWLAVSSQLVVAVLATGCSAVVDVRSLATGRVDVSAYELRGPELAMLQREARRLCPQGGEVMRQSGRDQRPANSDGTLRQWMNATSELLDPPKRQSQLVVVCKESVDNTWAATTSPAIDSAVAPAALPLAPLAVEW